MREIALLVMLEEAEVDQAMSGLVEHRKRLEPRLDLAARENSCGSVVNRSELLVPSRSAELHDVYG